MPQTTDEQVFKDAEASLLLEGLTPSDFYHKVKARILAGEITTQEGKDTLIAHHKALNAGVASAAVA